MNGDRIGNWQEDGFNCWRNLKYPSQFVRIDQYEDCDQHDPDKCDCHEVWLGDDETGNCDREGIFDSFTEAMREAKLEMMQNPNGWLTETKKKKPFIFR